jgi:serine protease AprX
LRPFFILLLYLFEHAAAQEYKFLIHFSDKNNNGYSLTNPSAFLSEKSIHRRLKQNIPVDSADLPVSSVYMDSLNTIPSLQILNRSKWFNQVLVTLSDSSAIMQIQKLSFVLSAEPVNNHRIQSRSNRISVNRLSEFSGKSVSEKYLSAIPLHMQNDYGASWAQVHIHHGEYLHDLGFHGEGMTIAILDDGFNNYLLNPAFDSIRKDHRIMGTYDFVNGKTSVNEEEVHGANCFSIIASNIPGILIGSAPAASYWLFKTEDDRSETPVEEQNWAAAAEYADSVGADLISTSLGYSYFDDSAFDITYPARNGHSSLVTRAANMAVAKGMIVTAAAGNSGTEPSDRKYVSCPADGDSVYAVGSVNAGGIIAASSSWGPNGAGHVKPDGVSLGAGAYFVAGDGNAYAGSGTSYANPNLAGLITCVWQAFPEFNVHDILSAVHQSSDLFSAPNGRYGYGLPDFEKAYQILSLKRIALVNPLSGDDWIHIFPVPFHNRLNIFLLPSASGTANIGLLDVSGRMIDRQTVPIVSGQTQLVEFPIHAVLSPGVYLIRYTDQKQSKTIKVIKD